MIVFNKKIIIIIITILISFCILYLYITNNTTNCNNIYNKLQKIQLTLEKLQNTFDKKINMLKNNQLDINEFIKYSKNHINNMENSIKRYDDISTKSIFLSSIKLFKTSAITQLTSDKMIIESIKNNDQENIIRSKLLLQKSFEYESAAISLFNLTTNEKCK